MNYYIIIKTSLQENTWNFYYIDRNIFHTADLAVAKAKYLELTQTHSSTDLKLIADIDITLQIAA